MEQTHRDFDTGNRWMVRLSVKKCILNVVVTSIFGQNNYVEELVLQKKVSSIGGDDKVDRIFGLGLKEPRSPMLD